MSVAVFPVLVHGERVTLREVEPGDLAAASELAEHLTNGALGPAEWIADAQRGAEAPRRERYALTIERAGVPAGFTSLVVEEVERRGELGYAVVPGHRRDGIASETVGLMCRLAFDVLGLRRVFALTPVDNVASISVLEGAGFANEGRLRDHDATGVDSYVYGLLVTDRGRVRGHRRS